MATLYGATGGGTNSDLYTIDPVTGVWTSVGPIGFAVTGLAFDPGSGFLYGATSNASPTHPHSLITVDPATGAGTFVGAFPTALADIAFKNDGTLYGISANSSILYSIDKSTGAITGIGPGGPSGAGKGFEIDGGDNGFCFLEGVNTGDSFELVDMSTGRFSDVGVIQNGDDFPFEFDVVSAASFDDAGVLWLLLDGRGVDPDGLATLAPDGTFTASIGSGILLGDALAWQGSVKPNPWIGNPSFSPNTLLAARASGYTTSDLYTVDPATGVLTSVGPIGFAVTGLAQDPLTLILYGVTGRTSAVGASSLITIDPETGAGTLVGAESTRNPWTDIAFDSFGRLFAQGQSGWLLIVDKASGSGTTLGSAGGVTVGGALAINSLNAIYAAPKGADASDNLYAVSTAGVYTPIALFNGAGTNNAMFAAGFDSVDVMWAVTGPTGGPTFGNLVTVDTVTADLTVVAPLSLDGVDALCWAQTATATNDFSISLTPPTLTIFRGNNDTTSLDTAVTTGVAQSITLSDTGAPIGVSLSYAANPIMSGDSTTVTVTVTGAASPGVYPITIHAVGTDVTHNVGLTVTVPGPVDDAYTVDENRTLTVDEPGVMANDILPTTVTLNTGPSHGILTLNADGSFTYVPDPGFLGVDIWTYDGNGGTATVTMTVRARDPTAVFDSGDAFKVAG